MSDSREEILSLALRLTDLHRQGHTIAEIAEEAQLSKRDISTLIGIGYLPRKLFEEKIRSCPFLTTSYLRTTLRLRLTENGQFLNGGYYPPGYDLLDYSEVEAAVDKVIAKELISLRDLIHYVEERQHIISEKNNRPAKHVATRERLKDQLRREVEKEFQLRGETTVEQQIRTARKKMDDAHSLRDLILWKKAAFLNGSPELCQILIEDIRRDIETLITQEQALNARIAGNLPENTIEIIVEG